MKRVLIIGGGSRLARCFREMFPNQTINLDRKQCDITSEKSIAQAFARHRFDYVLNCAALTDMEECQENPAECFRVNVLGPFLLNQACLDEGKKLIHLSSDYAVDPVNHYGWSKFLAEQVVDEKFLVIRTSFFSSQTFIIKNLLAGKKTNVFRNLYFNPVSINRLSREVWKNINRKGLVNIFGSKKISFLQFAKLFSRIFKIDPSLIHPVLFESGKAIGRKKISVIRTDIKIDSEKDMRDFAKYYHKSL